MVETKVVNSPEILSTEQKRNGFHSKYLALCKSKNLMPVPEVKAKQKNFQVLDFHADRIRPQDWLAICNSLHSDKTLKFVAIRLRRNNERVLEEMDSLKKAQKVVTHPVIYTKFFFTLLVEALEHLLAKNSVLETLVLEGLPLDERYMMAFTKGLSQNKSVTTLSLARSQISDAACESLCSTIKHMKEVKTFILSGCNLSFKGAEAVASLIKFQKIQRFSDAWGKSLRYQNIDSDAFHGLRKISLNNNPEIENQGLEILLEALSEDAWIKEMEMQNCGLDDEGAQSIIKCLSINKSILSFNIAGNHDVSEVFHRQISINLGNIEHDNSDSSDSKSSSEKLTKTKLIENLHYALSQLETEVFRRKQMEILNETLNKQLVEAQKELMIQGAVRVPEGFTLIATQTLNEMIEEGLSEDKVPQVIRNNRQRQRINAMPRKTRSVIIRKPKNRVEKASRSDHLINSVVDVNEPVVIENNIGDAQTSANIDSMNGPDLLKMFTKKKESQPPAETPLRSTWNDNDGSCTANYNSMSGVELIKMFAKKKKESQTSIEAPSSFAMNGDPRTLFFKGCKKVPDNSETDCDESDSQ